MVLENATQEMSVLPPDAMGTTNRTVVLAIDTSAHASRAFNWALENYLRVDDNIYLVNAQEHTQAPPEKAIPTKEEGYQCLKTYAQELKKRNMAVHALMLYGNYSTSYKDMIVEKVNEIQPSALIMGSRGMSAAKRVFLGSMSDYCLHHCTCPVIIVKPEPEAKKPVAAVNVEA